MAIILDSDVIVRGERGTFDLGSWVESRPDDQFEIAAVSQLSNRAIGVLGFQGFSPIASPATIQEGCLRGELWPWRPSRA
jgi:hypothetical protein